MKRSEQDIRFQWDLTKIFPDEAAWEAAMQQAAREVEEYRLLQEAQPPKKLLPAAFASAQ